jgi:hypothetical protein
MACENCTEDNEYQTFPAVTVADRWVAVQRDERGVIHVLHEDGSVTERLTVPAINNNQLAVGGAA